MPIKPEEVEALLEIMDLAAKIIDLADVGVRDRRASAVLRYILRDSHKLNQKMIDLWRTRQEILRRDFLFL